MAPDDEPRALRRGHLLPHQVEDARAFADRAVMLARERGESGHEAWALRLLGEITSLHEPPRGRGDRHGAYGAAMALAA